MYLTMYMSAANAETRQSLVWGLPANSRTEEMVQDTVFNCKFHLFTVIVDMFWAKPELNKRCSLTLFA